MTKSGARRAFCMGHGGAGGIKPGHDTTTIASDRDKRQRFTSKAKCRRPQRRSTCSGVSWSLCFHRHNGQDNPLRMIAGSCWRWLSM
jgi:hypothetical protein